MLVPAYPARPAPKGRITFLLRLDGNCFCARPPSNPLLLASFALTASCLAGSTVPVCAFVGLGKNQS